jgi:hypothetical protein
MTCATAGPLTPPYLRTIRDHTLAEEFTDEYCFDIAIVPQGLYSPGYNLNVLIFPHRVRWKTYKYENFQPYGNSDGTRY